MSVLVISSAECRTKYQRTQRITISVRKANANGYMHLLTISISLAGIHLHITSPAVPARHLSYIGSTLQEHISLQMRNTRFLSPNQDACTQRHRCIAASAANILTPAHFAADVSCGRSYKIRRFWMPANKGGDQAIGAVLLRFYSWSDYDDSTYVSEPSQPDRCYIGSPRYM
jgi:hypothetical protein